MKNLGINVFFVDVVMFWWFCISVIYDVDDFVRLILMVVYYKYGGIF